MGLDVMDGRAELAGSRNGWQLQMLLSEVKREKKRVVLMMI